MVICSRNGNSIVPGGSKHTGGNVDITCAYRILGAGQSGVIYDDTVDNSTPVSIIDEGNVDRLAQIIIGSVGGEDKRSLSNRCRSLPGQDGITVIDIVGVLDKSSAVFPVQKSDKCCHLHFLGGLAFYIFYCIRRRINTTYTFVIQSTVVIAISYYYWLICIFFDISNDSAYTIGTGGTNLPCIIAV